MAEETDTAGQALPVVEPDEIVASLGVPAVFVNRAVVQLGAAVRIAFGEQVVTAGSTRTEFRVAVALPHTTAIEVAKILTRLLKDIEAEIETAKAEGVTGLVMAEKPHG